MNKRRFDPELFIHAAEMLDSGEVSQFSCVALQSACRDYYPAITGYQNMAECQAYAEAFRDPSDEHSFLSQVTSIPQEDRHQFRVMMLLFAAELARTGDL